MTSDLGDRVHPPQIAPARLHAWIASGLKKLYPAESESVLLRDFLADLEEAPAEEQDQMMTDLRRRFDAIGHRV